MSIHIIIDGYNLIRQSDSLYTLDRRDIQLGRKSLLDTLAAYKRIKRHKITVVFDGANAPYFSQRKDQMKGIEIKFSRGGESADPRLRTRLDIDEWFGTVVNRFVAQAIIGIPLTLHGSGEQIRGFIALEDAMQCMTRLIASPPEPGQYAVVNQMSGFSSLREIAKNVAKIGKEEFNLPVKIQRVENPRVESERHPFEPIYENLHKKFGFKPKVSLEEEICRMFKLLTKPEIKRRIEEKKHHIIPKTWWSGEKRKVETIEIFELEEEIAKSEGKLKNRGQ